MVHPVLQMTDVQKVVLQVAPQMANGEPSSPTVTWTSDDPSVGINVSADTFSCEVTTPLERGAANITAYVPGYETEIQPIAYSPGLPGKLNMSVGTPVSDLEG